MKVGKNTRFFSMFCFALLLLIGCNSQPIRILSEKVLVPPPLWLFPGDMYIDVGIKDHDYLEIWEGIKILRTTLMEKGEEYIFEIQCAGDIELAVKKYGNRLIFHIQCAPGHEIFTSGSMKEAILVEREEISVEITKNNKGEMISGKMLSPSKEVARLDIKIDRDKMWIHLPKKYLPEEKRNYYWVEDDTKSFNWIVRLRLAVPPLKPIPSNIKGLFYAPTIYLISSSPSSSSIYEEELWRIKHVSE